MESMMCGTNNMLLENSLLLRENQWETSTHTLQCLWKCCDQQKHRSPGEKLECFRKTELSDLPQSILPQLLVLKCCSVLRPLFARNDASQLNNWHSVFQSAKEESVTSSEILDIRRGSRDGFLRAPVELRTERKTEGQTFLFCTVRPEET